MYSSRGSNAYGDQQTYSSQSAYAQKLGTGYSGSSAGGPDGSSQLSMGSRHWSMIGGPQEPDMSGYRTHNPSAGAHYAGQYSSVYGSSGLNSSQQVPQITTKGSGPSALDGRGNYGSSVPDSPKFASGNYVSSSSHGYGRRSDPLLSDKIPDYSSIDRRQYGERQGAYMERDLQIETGRYPDSGGHGLQNQPDMYDRLDQASSVLRQEQLLKAQSLQSAALDRSSRQADYLARGATTHHPAQDLTSYGQRMDADPRSLTLLSGSSYGNQHAASILGAAPRRNTDDLVYAQSSSTPGYGVSLPPGRDYGTGKGLRGASHELDFPSGMLTRSDYPRIDERKDDRGTYARELERREEERHRDYLREREKDREREKERERERERIRIRERERERDRERERERERERILERREKERDKERKRGSEIRRERSPPRISRERHGSSSAKDARTLRRESPLHESSHRRRSPVKEKRREYDCKVYSSSLVNVERDYLSLDKRYPRLFISPECSKVVVNWPRTNLKLPINTPVSFEHDFVEEGARAEQQELSTNLQVNEPLKSEFGTTVWNAKMILMSGLSQNAIEELSSDRSYDDRIPHFCNMLRFAILKKDNSFMAIGGPWSTVDGGDPSDENSLVQTVVRYAKDITHLDLKNCRHWNRFLEIHYDRLGKDGLFSHKEVTVLYVPDLSDCLPSLDAWRDQWLAHKKAISERERHNALKKEKPKEKGGPKDKELESVEVKKENKLQKGKEPGTSGLAVDADKKENDVKTLTANSAEKSAVETDKKIEKKDGSETVAKDSNVEGQGKLEESAAVPTVASVKSGKKKIVKKVVKQKVAIKKEDVETTTKLNDKLDEKDVAEETAKEISQEHNSSSNSVAVKTFTRKKVAKKVPVKKAAQKEDELNHPEKEIISAPDTCEDTSKVESANAAVVQDASSKTTVKKKIIRKVPKRKAAVEEANDKNKDEKNVVQAGDEAKATIAEQAEGTDSQVNEVKLDNAIVTKADLKPSTNEKPNKVVGDDKEEEKTTNEKFGSGLKAETEDKSKIAPDDGRSGSKEKLKEKEKAKDDKEKKDRDGKEEPRSKSNREVKEKKKPAEEPPRRPGLFVQIKGAKDSKLRSLSLSLDSLLDYSENDIDESTFELSLFAEALYEMLQYQMGCRLLTFLQKLRIKFVQKRNQRKRERDEAPEEKDRTSSVKRAKTEDITVENKSNKTETEGEASLDHGKAAAEDATSTDRVEKVKREDGKDEEEDMEEDPEEDEEMPDASAQHESANKETTEGEKTEKDALSDKVTGDEKDGEQGTTEGEKTEKDAISEKVIGIENDGEQKTVNVSGEADAKLDADKKGKVEKKKESLAAVDKELLQAFRFFDRNRVGYVRVEDMRLIIHNLGKFLSHRDVKELVQSALLESNTGRDDRILYNKLVKISDI